MLLGCLLLPSLAVAETTGSLPAAAPSVPAVPQLTRPQSEPGAAGEGAAPIEVRVSASRPGAVLEQLGSLDHPRPDSAGQALCQAPCTGSADPGGLFRIGGPGIRRSSAFMLPRDERPVTLSVRAGANSRHRAGVALLVAGSILTSAGLITAAIAESAAVQERSQDRATALRLAGYPTLALGVVGLVVGIPLYLRSQTEVTLDSGMRLAHLGSVYLTPSGLAF